MSLIFSNFVVTKQTKLNIFVMRNWTANFVKILDICKHFSKNLVDERGNMPRRGVVPRFSDLEVIALTVLQYINFINNKPIGRVKYALI